jgi:hypothetical protein
MILAVACRAAHNGGLVVNTEHEIIRDMLFQRLSFENEEHHGRPQ